MDHSDGEMLMSGSGKEAEIASVPYFLVLLAPGGNHAAAAEHFAAHVRFIEEMEAANVVLLGGDFGAPVGGAEAAYLLHCSCEAEALAWAARDPLVQSDAYRPQVVVWNLVGVTVGAIDAALR